MHRSIAWSIVAVVAILLAPFVGALGAPAVAVRAEVAAPAAPPPDDEIIVITAAGQLRVDDPYTTPGYQPVSWNSGGETGWTVVAGGDFNGDGDAELVAARGSFVKVFDPIVQPGRAPVEFSADMGSQKNVRLLNTGDFDADGKDEFAVMHYIPGTGYQAGLVWYDGGTNATLGEWTRKNSTEYGGMFQDMSTGDFNADGADDLVMVRNANQQRLVTTLSVRTWSTIAEGTYSRPWFAVAGGNISTSTPGDEISLTRDGANAATEGLILFKVVGTKLEDLVASTAWRWNPDFVSLSNGDLNGDGDDEVVMLRDPTWATTSLLMVNPVGATMNPFEQATGYGNTAFRIVRTGDTDGDGKEEIVILRADRYRLYTEPNVDSRVLETTGAFYTPGSVSNLPFMAVANVDGGGQSTGPTLSVTPSSLSFNLDFGATSPVKPLSITNSGTGSNLAWQAQAIEDQVAQGGPWLLIDATSGATPGTVNVRVRTDISPNTYSGKIRITTTDPAVPNKTVDVPVTYTLAQGQGFVVSPGTLNFTVPWGSTGSQSVAIGAAGPTTWTAEILSGSPWLTLGATSGAAPGSLNIFASSVAAGIGTWQGTVKITAGTPMPNSPQYVTIDLRVPDPGFVVSPTEITIWQKINGPTVTRQVKIERPKAPTNWTASALPLNVVSELAEKLANGQATVTTEGLIVDGQPVAAPAWLEFTPVAGITPATMTVSVKQGTPAGTYRVVITVAASGDPTLTNPVQMVNVTAYVGQFQTTFLPLISQ